MGLLNKVMTLNHIVGGEWNWLWCILAQPKVNHLTWRCQGCLPSRVRLHGCYEKCPTSCLLCLGVEEDDCHVFFGCKESKRIWIELGLEVSIEGYRLSTMCEYFYLICM
jgi:hypothetical protein